MTEWIDLTGKRYGRWAVESLWEPTNRNFWRCRCDCGNVRRVLGLNLRNGKSQSCDCLRKEIITKHGMVNHPAYTSWNAARKRCRYKNGDDYANYGGRGIEFDTRWDDFNQFWADMGPTWFKGSSLDRWPDTNGNYAPGNVRWATAREQGNNRQRHAMIPTPRGPMRIMEASIAYGIDYMTLYSRLKMKWPASEMLTPSTIDRKKGAPLISRTLSFTMQRIEQAVTDALIGRFPNYTFREGGVPMQETKDFFKDVEERLISGDLTSRAPTESAAMRPDHDF